MTILLSSPLPDCHPQKFGEIAPPQFQDKTGQTLAKNSCTLLPSHLEMLPADLHGSDTYIATPLSWSTTT
jgi:hypothetical protein